MVSGATASTAPSCSNPAESVHRYEMGYITAPTACCLHGMAFGLRLTRLQRDSDPLLDRGFDSSRGVRMRARH